MAVHGDGYCYNNEVNNKRTMLAVCDNQPVSQEYSLNFMMANLNNWTQALTEASLSQTYINPCDANVLVSNPIDLIYNIANILSSIYCR